MKKLLATITFTVVLFTSVLINLSCKDASQDNTTTNTTANNAATNANRSNLNQNSESDSTLSINCNISNSNRQQDVIDEIKKNIRKEPILRKQYDNKKFDFDVVDESGKLVVYFGGRVYTEPDDKVNELNKTFKKLVKKGCVSKVVFGQQSKGKTALPAGFDYMLCEDPNGVCSDGTCRLGCLAVVKDNTNMNANTDTNANTNANVSKR